MAWGQWTSPDLTFGECMQRAPKALKAEGLSAEQSGRIWFGASPGPVSATVFCYGLGKGANVTIFAANPGASGQGGPSDRMVTRLADRIFTNEEPKPTPGSPPVPQTAPAPTSTCVVTWKTRGRDINKTGGDPCLRGDIGSRLTWTCPPNGTSSPAYGGNASAGNYTGIYEDASSLCTAAVHAGLITLEKGGSVTFQLIAGQDDYYGSTQHGVTSATDHYMGWPRSFVFVSGAQARVTPTTTTPKTTTPTTTTAPKTTTTAPAPSGGSGWGATAEPYRGKNGQRFSFTCPPNGPTGLRLYGSGVFTDDSSVCTAGVFAGVVTLAKGGTVTIEIQPGQASYPGGSQNGITSGTWNSWVGSFSVVGK